MARTVIEYSFFNLVASSFNFIETILSISLSVGKLISELYTLYDNLAVSIT